MNNTIVGLWSGHDTSFCYLVDGRPVVHSELERHTRVKEDMGDSLLMWEDYATKNNVDVSDIQYVTCHPVEKLHKKPNNLIVCGHHQSHAAHAFYSSNINKALVMTIDGGGLEAPGVASATTVWIGNDTKLEPFQIIPDHTLNIGMIWTRVTRYVFGFESGWPYGHQAGTVMAMAALGDPSKYIDEVRTWFTSNTYLVQSQPPGHVRGMSAKNPARPRHPYLGKFEDIIKANPDEAYPLAAAFQQATEELIVNLIRSYVKIAKNNLLIEDKFNLCLAGGVSLNSLITGRLRKYLASEGLQELYIPPVPYDAGLSIGAAQYVHHHINGAPRVQWVGSCSPYLGQTYSEQEIEDDVTWSMCDAFEVCTATDDVVVDMLADAAIVSVFHGGAESGRRALGNRSIIADPRNPRMKDIVNEKVKHRQWFRPFAPSVLSEEAHNWFEGEIDSPYMSFVAMVKKDKIEQLPAITHFDGSARLQTVHRETNEWYHTFITKWFKKSGVPVLLNTSFNNCEPICETPQNAINCFLNTNIDALYFVDANLLLKKKSLK